MEFPVPAAFSIPQVESRRISLHEIDECGLRRLSWRARRRRTASLDVSIDVLAMPDPDDMDDQLAVVLQDAIPTLAYPIAFMAGQLLRSCRARIVSQRLDTPDDPATIRFGGIPSSSLMADFRRALKYVAYDSRVEVSAVYRLSITPPKVSP